MSETPRTDKAFKYSQGVDCPDLFIREKMKELELELGFQVRFKNVWKKRAWAAQAKLEERYGLRKEINSAIGITDETGDDALKKGLETINALKRENELMKDALKRIRTACMKGSLLLIASIGSELENSVKL